MAWIICMENIITQQREVLREGTRIDADEPRWGEDVHIIPVAEGIKDEDLLTSGAHEFSRDCPCHPKVQEQCFNRTLVTHKEKVN